jgi:6-phosphogluconate dehydrogenase (decarboxylating)
MTMEPCMIRLGRMGSNMTEQLILGGHAVKKD